MTRYWRAWRLVMVAAAIGWAYVIGWLNGDAPEEDDDF